MDELDKLIDLKLKEQFANPNPFPYDSGSATWYDGRYAPSNPVRDRRDIDDEEDVTPDKEAGTLHEDDDEIEEGILNVKCAWCGKDMGSKDSQGAPSGTSHGMCPTCQKKELTKYGLDKESKEVTEAPIPFQPPYPGGKPGGEAEAEDVGEENVPPEDIEEVLTAEELQEILFGEQVDTIINNTLDRLFEEETPEIVKKQRDRGIGKLGMQKSVKEDNFEVEPHEASKLHKALEKEHLDKMHKFDEVIKDLKDRMAKLPENSGPEYKKLHSMISVNKVEQERHRQHSNSHRMCRVKHKALADLYDKGIPSDKEIDKIVHMETV